MLTHTMYHSFYTQGVPLWTLAPVPAVVYNLVSDNILMAPLQHETGVLHIIRL